VVAVARLITLVISTAKIVRCDAKEIEQRLTSKKLGC
jgi:hypothetical protein